MLPRKHKKQPGCKRHNEVVEESGLKKSKYTDVLGKDEGANRQNEKRSKSEGNLLCLDLSLIASTADIV